MILRAPGVTFANDLAGIMEKQFVGRMAADVVVDDHCRAVELGRHLVGGVRRDYGRTAGPPSSLRGYLFQGRFASYPMDDTHLIAAIRYVENNPVAARLVGSADDWPWSSARSHIAGRGATARSRRMDPSAGSDSRMSTEAAKAGAKAKGATRRLASSVVCSRNSM